MNNGLLFFGGLLVVVLAALFAVPNFVDWTGYRGVFEEEASKVLGRDVRVGGSVNLKLLPVPYVRFEKIRIANITGQTGEPFVRAESFTMWLSGPALLRGVLEASEVELNKPVLTLALDGNGGGNWTNIELKPGDLPFVPRDVSLRSVKLIDGAVSIYNSTSDRIALLDGINGELSADGLRGPFRFKGAASWSGNAHELKFATDTPAPDGSFSLKVAARVDQSPNVYLLDGRVSDLDRKPAFTGDWSGKLAVPGGDAFAVGGKTEAPVLDLKSKVTADFLGAKFDDIALSLDDAAEAQTITGSANATWAGAPRLDVVLASKWLDIDWLAGAGRGAAPFAKLKQLAVGLMHSVAGDGTASAKIDLQQVKMGGETAGGLSLDAERRGGVTHFNTLKASLPGGSRLDLTGDLKDEAGLLSFSGNAFVGGSNLARLRSWASKSGIPIDVTASGPFSVGGKVDIDRSRFSLADASGEISGRALAGDLTITHDDNHSRTDATLHAPEIDTSDVFPKTAAALETEISKALGLAPAVDEKSGDDKPADALPDGMRLRVVAGKLTNAGETYHDVDVTFDLENGEFRLPAAKLTTSDGLAVGLEGRIKTAGGVPAGALSYDLVAASPAATADLALKIGLARIVGEDRFKGLKEAKLAGLLRFGRGSAAAADISFDGTANGAHFSGAGEFEGGLSKWRERPSRLQMTFDAPSLPALLVAIGRDVRGAAATDAAPAPLQASVIATGILDTGAETRIELKSPNMAMTFEGRTTWPQDATFAANGALNFKATDYADALSVVGISLPRGASGIATHGMLEVARDKGEWSIASRGFSLGTSMVTGAVKLLALAGGAQRLEGKIGADRVSVAAMFSPFIGKSSDAAAAPPDTAAAGAGNAAAMEARAIWPDGVFDFDALGANEANVHLSFAALDLSGNVATRDGEMQLGLSPGKIGVRDIAADAAGGTLTGELKLAKAPNGVTLTTTLKLDRAKLASLSPAAKGFATIDFNADARAQSPAGLVAVLSGTGNVALDNAALPGPSASMASGVVETVLHGKQQNDPRILAASFLTALDTSQMDIGSRRLSMRVVDGAVKLDTVTLDTPEGKVDATTTADLTSLNVQAACQIASVIKPLSPQTPLPGWTPPAPKAPLPPAVVLYSGQLDNLPGIKADVDVANLQRELVVRQMERNVEELELSRRVDEERARRDKELRKAAEDQRAAAAAAARAKRLAPPAAAQTPPAPNAAAPDTAPTPAPSAAAPPSSDDPPAATASQPQDGPAPQADQQPETKPGEAGNTLLTPKISIEPIPPPSQQAQGDASSAAPIIDPETGLPIAAKPQTAFRPQRPQTPKRTSSDEVMKSLGGFP